MMGRAEIMKRATTVMQARQLSRNVFYRGMELCGDYSRIKTPRGKLLRAEEIETIEDKAKNGENRDLLLRSLMLRVDVLRAVHHPITYKSLGEEWGVEVEDSCNGAHTLTSYSGIIVMDNNVTSQMLYFRLELGFAKWISVFPDSGVVVASSVEGLNYWIQDASYVSDKKLQLMPSIVSRECKYPTSYMPEEHKPSKDREISSFAKMLLDRDLYAYWGLDVEGKPRLYSALDDGETKILDHNEYGAIILVAESEQIAETIHASCD